MSGKNTPSPIAEQGAELGRLLPIKMRKAKAPESLVVLVLGFDFCLLRFDF